MVDGLTPTQRYRLKDVDAYRAKKAAYARTPEERAKRTAYMRKWRAANRAKHNEQAKQSHHRNKHKHVGKRRDEHLRRLYGISQAKYEEMLDAQGGVCAICEEPPNGGKALAVDHCHETGVVRGLLCSGCNGSLGWYERRRVRVKLYLEGDYGKA